MLNFDISLILDITITLANIREDFRHRAPNFVRPTDVQRQEAAFFSQNIEYFGTIGMTYSKIQSERMARRLSLNQPVSSSECTVMCADLAQRIRDELSRKILLTISDLQRDLYHANAPLFGQEVADKFPSDAAFEIDEAAKCLALGRSTASVFHLMRTLEIGIRAIARCLDIPDPVKSAERNWGAILRTIRNAIGTLWATSSDRVRPEAILFESLLASLDAVRNPWRNAVMHVETKYTEDEAEHIFIAVKGFMRKLASRCDEEGEPKA